MISYDSLFMFFSMIGICAGFADNAALVGIAILFAVLNFVAWRFQRVGAITTPLRLNVAGAAFILAVIGTMVGLIIYG